MQQALLSAGLPPPGIAPGQYSGRVKSYNPKQGYGFLECAEARAHYGRDVFIHKAQMGELLGRFVGPGTRLEPTTLRMRVHFSVEVNKSGMPQARDVVRIDNPSEAEAAAALPATAAHDGASRDGPETSPGPESQAESEAQPSFAPELAEAEAPAGGGDREAWAGDEAPAGGGAEAWAGEEAQTAQAPAGEAWAGDEAQAAKVKGYKGRGGTIRILSSSEGQGAAQAPTASPEEAAGPAPRQGGGGLAAAPQDLAAVGPQPPPTQPQPQPARGIRNRGWPPRGQRRQGGQGAPGRGDVDPFVAQQEAWEGMEEEQAYGMKWGSSGSGGAGRAGPREGGRRRGKQAECFQPWQQLPPTGRSDQALPQQVYAAQGGISYMQPQQFAVQPYAPSAVQMYGVQGPQPMPGQQAAPAPATYAAPYAPQQFQPTFVSHQFPQPPVQPAYQPDPNAPCAQQFLPYQQYQQQFPPQQLQMMHQAAWRGETAVEEPPTGCYSLEGNGVCELREGNVQSFNGERQEMPNGCLAEHDSDWTAGIDTSSGIPDVADPPLAATPGSGSEDEDGRLGFRAGNLSLLHGGCPGPGAALLALLPGALPGGLPVGCVPCAGLVAGGSPPVAATQVRGGWQQAAGPVPHTAGRGRDYLAL